MPRRVPLDNVEHAQLRLIERVSADAHVNQALVLPSEFEQLQREYPIMFVGDDDEFQAVAILGLERGENLFIEGGAWTAHYVPATLRRGPFFLAVDESGDAGGAALVVDLDDARVSESEGDPLFLLHGGAAPVLEGRWKHYAPCMKDSHTAAPCSLSSPNWSCSPSRNRHRSR